MKKRLAFIVASPLTYLAFLKCHASVLRHSFDITLIADFSSYQSMADFEGINTIHVGLKRDLSIFDDLGALVHLTRILSQRRFDIIHSVTPKAGLLSAFSGRLARCPIRVHTYTGQVWATRRGLARTLLKTMDKLTLSCVTQALADSPSQVRFLLSEGFRKRIDVLGDGSVAGVDVRRFRREEGWRDEVRNKYGLAQDDFVFVFLGRLTRDKGVLDLLEGFARAKLHHSCKLLIVGPDEADLAAVIRNSELFRDRRVVLGGSTDTPERELNAGDVLCLPSYREGFGSVVLEAAAIGLPASTSRIYGLTDAVVEGETGIMHEAGNAQQIAACLQWFAENPDRTRLMGIAAKTRVEQSFSTERITKELLALYWSLLREVPQIHSPSS